MDEVVVEHLGTQSHHSAGSENLNSPKKEQEGSQLSVKLEDDERASSLFLSKAKFTTVELSPKQKGK